MKRHHGRLLIFLGFGLGTGFSRCTMSLQISRASAAFSERSYLPITFMCVAFSRYVRQKAASGGSVATSYSMCVPSSLM